MVHTASIYGLGGGQIDTIAAVATPPGKGAVAIIRISGPKTFQVAQKVVGKLPEARYVELRDFCDSKGDVIDNGLVICFLGPRSYTGEDVVELQGHGGPAVVAAVFSAVCEAGARPAQRGEFTERAFLNGQLELSQAEAVAALIDAESQTARRAAMRSLEGQFGRQVDHLAESILELRSLIEADLDFPDEDDSSFVDLHVLEARLTGLLSSLQEMSSAARAGSKLRSGFRVVLMGRPNVGKSMLMNQLAGRDASIVTANSGTTRDLIRDRLALANQEVEVIDTAGIREAGGVDAVEAEGVKRAKGAIGEADAVVLVVDSTVGVGRDEIDLVISLQNQKLVVAFNKTDLLVDRSIDVEQILAQLEVDSGRLICLSASTGEGVSELKESLARLVSNNEGGELFAAEQRHIEALRGAEKYISKALGALQDGTGLEVLAELLRSAQAPLQEITGRGSSEDVLDGIFSRFCFGK